MVPCPALFFLPVGIADHLLGGPYVIGPAFLEVLEVQLLDELRQGHLPGLLLRVGEAAELLGIEAQLSGHLDVGIGKMETLPRLDLRLVLLPHILLRHELSFR